MTRAMPSPSPRSSPQPSRRAVLAAGAAALAPLPLAGQGAAPIGGQAAATGKVAFAARMRALAGVDPLPRDLVAGLYDAMRQAGSLDAVMRGDGGAAAREAETRALEALYHGIWAGGGADGTPRRLSFTGALQWAVIEETNNVISYCGGVPGFWAQAPDIEA